MWSELSNFGDAALTLPIAMMSTAWLAIINRRQAIRWVALLAIGMTFVGATKLLYAGCGIEIFYIDFRVISGHTMLATSIWTVTLSLLWQALHPDKPSILFPGFMIGGVIALARVLDHSHTVPEVIVGWIVGASVALAFLGKYQQAETNALSRRVAVISLLLFATIAYGHRAPIQHLIDTRSPNLCAFARSKLTDAIKANKLSRLRISKKSDNPLRH